MAMATAATKRNATITITPGKPQNPKRYKNQEDDNPIKNLEGFVNSNGGVGVGAKSRPKPFENRYDTEYLSKEMTEIKGMFRGPAIQLNKLEKLEIIEEMVRENNKSLKEAQTEIRKVKEENVKLREKVTSLEEKVAILDSQLGGEKFEKLESRVIDIQARSMRDNLVFFNVEETENEQTNTEDLVHGIIKDKMGIEENVEFERVHRMGAKWKRSGERRIRPIVAKFSSHKIKEKVKFAAKNLAATNIGVSEQFPPEIEAKRKELWPAYKQAKREGKKAKLVVDKLYVDNQLVILKKTEMAPARERPAPAETGTSHSNGNSQMEI